MRVFAARRNEVVHGKLAGKQARGRLNIRLMRRRRGDLRGIGFRRMRRERGAVARWR